MGATLVKDFLVEGGELETSIADVVEKIKGFLALFFFLHADRLFVTEQVQMSSCRTQLIFLKVEAEGGGGGGGGGGGVRGGVS